MTERIGYIGLGIMGRGMARNLLKAGFPLTVWNRTASRMDELVAEGAAAGKNPADVAANSDLIITCVSDTPDVEAVILGEQGVIHGAKTGALVIDHSGSSTTMAGFVSNVDETTSADIPLDCGAAYDQTNTTAGNSDCVNGGKEVVNAVAEARVAATAMHTAMMGAK